MSNAVSRDAAPGRRSFFSGDRPLDTGHNIPHPRGVCKPVVAWDGLYEPGGAVIEMLRPLVLLLSTDSATVPAPSAAATT
jgi:hypothetical protein